MKVKINKYDLDGGSKVTVYKIFGDRFYFAIVDMDGSYPIPGQLARNKGRNEFVLVIEGQITIVKNGTKKNLNEGGTILLNDGSRYEITGRGKSLVFVDDGITAKGKSLIEAKEK